VCGGCGVRRLVDGLLWSIDIVVYMRCHVPDGCASRPES
jgi:hypothetical protein